MPARPARLVALPLDDRTTPATTYRWTGLVDLKFSTAANWTKLSDAGEPLGPAVPPTDGTAALLFPDRSLVSASSLIAVNDLGGGADTAFDSLTFLDTYSLSDADAGRTVLLSGLTAVPPQPGVSITAPLRLAGPTTFTASPGVTVEVTGDLALGGNRLTVTGGGTVRLDAAGGTGEVAVTGNSTATFRTFNFAGTVAIEAGSIAGALGTGTIGSQVAFTGGGRLNVFGTLAGNSAFTREGPIALAGPAAAVLVQTGSALTLGAGASIPSGLGLFVNGTLNLTAPGQLPADAVPTLGGRLNTGGFPLTLAGVRSTAGAVITSKNADVVVAGSGDTPFETNLGGPAGWSSARPAPPPCGGGSA